MGEKVSNPLAALQGKPFFLASFYISYVKSKCVREKHKV